MSEKTTLAAMESRDLREQKGWNRLGYHSDNSHEREQHLNETGADKNEHETDSRDSQEVKSMNPTLNWM